MSVRTGTRSWVSGGKPDVRTLTTASLTIHKDARFKPNSRGFGLFCALAVQFGGIEGKTGRGAVEPQGASGLGFRLRGHLTQTCDANSLSRRDSKFQIIASKVSPVGGPGGLKTHAHWEQSQPRKARTIEV